MMSFRGCVAAVAISWALCGPARAQVDLDAYLKRDQYAEIKLSPGGEYFAATVPMEDRTALVVVNRADGKILNHFMMTRDTHVNRFDWVGDDRVVLSVAQKFGALDQPLGTGELFSLDALGGRFRMLGGYRAADLETASPTARNQSTDVVLELNDTLPQDDRYAIVSVTPFGRDLKYSTAERMDVTSGRRSLITRSPVKDATFTTDNKGQVRFASGAGDDNVGKLYYRADDAGEWRLLNQETDTGRREYALGFSADDTLAYLQVQTAQGPDAIVAWNPLSGERKQLLRDPVVDPGEILYRVGTNIPVGAVYASDRARTAFFDPAGPEARLYRRLERSMPEDAVKITSGTRDGRLMLVHAWSGRNPGQYFLFDTQARKVQSLFTRRRWIDTDQAAQVQAISLQARDGLALHGFLTRPAGSAGRRLPMVVVPHGGPIGEYDGWEYNGEAQLLAAAGYAVLQVNFRGSANYGRAFRQAGALEWGKAMQDDVTDATRWAVAQGYADDARICIYGASYGAYAALMGVAKEPQLYRCAAGYVGVYDLPMMFERGDVQQTRFGETYLHDWLGDPADLGEVSPVNLAARIKAPVFLAAGGKDERAPIRHTRKMAAALQGAGVPVETLYYDTEGHGFYTLAHQREFYGKLLAFLSRSLGGQQAAAAAQP